MATLATIINKNNILYIRTNPISATVENVNEFYEELEKEIKKTVGKFLLIVDLSNVKWLETEARRQMAERSDALYTNHPKTYIGKVLVIKNSLIRSMVSLFNSTTKKSSPQHITKSIDDAEKIAYELFYLDQKNTSS